MTLGAPTGVSDLPGPRAPRQCERPCPLTRLAGSRRPITAGPGDLRRIWKCGL